jgi:hypothetical protein
VTLCSLRRPSHWRWLTAGLVQAAGVGGCQYLMLDSVTATVGGERAYGISMAAGAIGLAGVGGLALARAMADTRALRHAFLGTALTGVALTAVHYLATLSVEVRTDAGLAPADQIALLDPMRIGVLTVVAGGVLTALLWFFTVGAATGRDLRVTFSPEPESAQLERWMQEQRRARSGPASPTDDQPEAPRTNETGETTYGLAAATLPIILSYLRRLYVLSI